MFGYCVWGKGNEEETAGRAWDIEERLGAFIRLEELQGNDVPVCLGIIEVDEHPFPWGGCIHTNRIPTLLRIESQCHVSVEWLMENRHLVEESRKRIFDKDITFHGHRKDIRLDQETGRIQWAFEDEDGPYIDWTKVNACQAEAEEEIWSSTSN